jgi:hypothetical protein
MIKLTSAAAIFVFSITINAGVLPPDGVGHSPNPVAAKYLCALDLFAKITADPNRGQYQNSKVLGEPGLIFDFKDLKIDSTKDMQMYSRDDLISSVLDKKLFYFKFRAHDSQSHPYMGRIFVEFHGADPEHIDCSLLSYTSRIVSLPSLMIYTYTNSDLLTQDF